MVQQLLFRRWGILLIILFERDYSKLEKCVFENTDRCVHDDKRAQKCFGCYHNWTDTGSRYIRDVFSRSTALWCRHLESAARSLWAICIRGACHRRTTKQVHFLVSNEWNRSMLRHAFHSCFLFLSPIFYILQYNYIILAE